MKPKYHQVLKGVGSVELKAAWTCSGAISGKGGSSWFALGILGQDGISNE